jgi:hypothetical protein
MKVTKMISLLALFGLTLGCTTEQNKTVSIDGRTYNLTSPDAKALAGGSTIPRRAESYGLPAGNLPRPMLASVSDEVVRARLDQALSAVLGLEAEASSLASDNGELVASHKGGFAVIAEGTGTLVVKKLGVARTATIVEDAEQAVDLALDGVAKSGLITLAKHETLDVVGVASTHYAGWVEDEGEGDELMPVYFTSPDSEETVTEYKSDYTVYFGRRYRGVPIIGPSLGVRLDAKGEMVAFMKGWRDIDGETSAVAVLDSTEVVSEATAAADDALELQGMACGFTEGTDTTQTAAGIGCALHYRNTGAVDPLAAGKVDWVSLASDSSIALGVESEAEAEADPGEETPTSEGDSSGMSEDDIPE